MHREALPSELVGKATYCSERGGVVDRPSWSGSSGTSCSLCVHPLLHSVGAFHKVASIPISRGVVLGMMSSYCCNDCCCELPHGVPLIAAFDLKRLLDVDMVLIRNYDALLKKSLLVSSNV